MPTLVELAATWNAKFPTGGQDINRMFLNALIRWTTMTDETNLPCNLDHIVPQTCEFVPYLSIKNAEQAIKFYSHVFGVEPEFQLDMPDGRVMHCEFRVGASRFFVSEELIEHGGTPSPKTLNATTVAIHLYVDDCDAMVTSMKENGAAVLMEPTDMFWGERFARVRDPFGHEWGITTQLRKMAPDEIKAAAAKLFEAMPE